MNPRFPRALSFVVCSALLCAVPACGRGEDNVRVGGSTFPAPPPRGTAVLCGSVIDLASGEPAAQALVSVAGREVRSDAAGRFEIDGLPAGTRGTVRARAADGREVALELLPLGGERREIVLSLPAR